MNEMLLNSLVDGVLGGTIGLDNVHSHEEQDTAFEKARQVLMPEGTFQMTTSAEIREKLTHLEIRLFMNKMGMYVLPTLDLVEDLKVLLPDPATTIEVGAGNGVIADALGIKATDSYQQHESFKPPKKYKDLQDQFRNSGVPMVQYGPNVLRVDAATAVKRFKPKAVLGCFVTHKYDKTQHDRKGNALGVDFLKLFKSVDRIVLVGNETVHELNPIMDLPTISATSDALITRAKFQEKNRIYVWDKKLIELDEQGGTTAAADELIQSMSELFGNQPKLEL